MLLLDTNLSFLLYKMAGQWVLKGKCLFKIIIRHKCGFPKLGHINYHYQYGHTNKVETHTYVRENYSQRQKI